jgi:hypothetical protein
MIYGEDHRFRNVIIVVFILGGTLLATLWYTDKLPSFLNFSQLQSNVLQAPPLPGAFTAEDLDYLENETGYIPSDENKTFEVNSTQPLKPQDLVDDLVDFLMAAEPRPTTVDEANRYLNSELFTVRLSPPPPAAPVLPLPPNISTVMTIAKLEFFRQLGQQTPAGTPTTTPTSRLATEEFEYLENETGYIPLRDVPLENVTLATFEQDLIEILLLADPKPTTKEDAIKYLNEELFTDPIPPAAVPATIARAIASAAQKSLTIPGVPPLPTTPPRPSVQEFITKFLSILTTHQSNANKAQVIERARTSRSLLEEFIKQL